MIVRLRYLPLLVPLAACTPPDPAPDDLSELLAFAWSHYSLDDPNNAVSLADAGVNFETWFNEDVEGLDDYQRNVGFQASLTNDSDRLPSDALGDLDPAPQFAQGENAVGVVVALHTRCSLADMDRLYAISDQSRLHPDSYISYERSEEADFDCFLEGSCDEYRWNSSIRNSLVLNAEAEFLLHNQVRRIQAESLDGTMVEARLGRTWMSREATIEPDGIGRWFQNYQMEYLLERPDGILHIYPQWVEVEVGEIDTEAGVFLNSYVEGLHEYILETEEHCIAGTE